MADFVERTFDLPGLGARTYRFPTRFSGVEILGAVATVPAETAAGWLPPPLQVRRLPGGRALVLFTVQRFARPAEFPGYEEASIAVMATAGKGRGFHVITMPVTSAENLARGPTIFGLPKEKAEVTLAGDGHSHSGTVDVGGERLFSLTVRPRLGLPVRAPVRSRYLQVQQGGPVHVDSRGTGKLQLGGAVVELGPLLQKRWSGKPSKLAPFAGFRISDAEISLHLPQPA